MHVTQGKFVTEMGTKRTWILLRGLGREAGHWDLFFDALKRAVGEDRILTPDLPGAGKNIDVRSPSTIPEITDWFRNECSVEGPVHLLGISLGGMIVLDWAQRFPDEVAGAVVINSSLGSISGPFQRMRPGVFGKFLGAVKERDPFRREKRILSFISNLRSEDEHLARRFAEIAEKRAPSRLSLFRQLVAAARFQPRDEAPLSPVLVLASSKDQMVHPECSRAIARKWGFRIIEHPEAGHDLPLDDPSWVASQVVSFFKDCRAPRSS